MPLTTTVHRTRTLMGRLCRTPTPKRAPETLVSRHHEPPNSYYLLRLTDICYLVDPQEPSSSRDIVERNMVLELYQSLTRTGGTRRPADVLLSECLLYDEDRDEVVTEVMRLLTKVCTDAVLGQANKAGIRKLCIALKDDFACGAMRIRKPDDFPVDAFSEEAFESKEVLECFLDTGLSLTSGWQVDPAHRTGVYTMQYLDVWYWTVRAGADDVMRKLENEDVKPGNGVVGCLAPTSCKDLY